jgi:FkbM family methyltransferase
MKCDGRHAPTRWQVRAARLRTYARKKCAGTLKVVELGGELTFLCHGVMEEYRVRTLFVKEEGTVNWIRDVVKPGDAFLDVGANIGLYSLLAAQRVGSKGVVYAVEPHIVNFQSLLGNVAINNFQDRVRPLSCALHEASAVLEFNYQSLDPGTSMSQLGGTRDGEEQEFRPVASELKQGVAVDDLIASGAMRPPNHVKIDVDGNELLVLRGMHKTLAGPQAPRTLQVEINARYRDALFGFLGELGFEKSTTHHTLNGKAMIAAGKQPDDIAHNAIFQPSRSHAARERAA